MYNIDLDGEENIKTIKDWLNERKLIHVATPNAGELYIYSFIIYTTVNFNRICSGIVPVVT